jgi:lysophospholipase L1-like esterase
MIKNIHSFFCRNEVRIPVLLILLVLFSSYIYIYQQQKPTLYLIGDSTVKNGRGDGGGGLWGWGSFIGNYFDTTRISVENHALGGTSSRTFRTKGLWDSVLNKLKPGDFVLMQFGHNDNGPLDDTARARGTFRSNGEESKEIYNPITKKNEVVHSYGWYLRKYITEAKAKGATAVVLSPVPRNSWKNGKVNRSSEDYGKWAAEAAKQEGAPFIDLNRIIAEHYDAEGEEKVRSAYFNTKDHTHTIEAGAKMNAAWVVEGIREQKNLALNASIRK